MRTTYKVVPSLPLLILITWITLTSGVRLTMAANGTPSSPPGAPKKNDDGALGGIITLYARDELARVLSLNDGGYGAVVQDHQVKNRDSQISFGAGKEDGKEDLFLAGVQGGEDGCVIDLGGRLAVEKEYGYEHAETTGHGQGFASIHLEAGKPVILKDRGNNFQPIKNIDALFRTGQEQRDAILQRLDEAQGDAERSKLSQELLMFRGANAALDHIYLVRVTRDKATCFAKLLVIAYQPHEWVTLRWEVIQPFK